MQINLFSCNFTAVKLKVIQSLVSQFIPPLEPMASSADLKFTFFDMNNDSPVSEQNSLCGFYSTEQHLLKEKISNPDILTQIAIKYLALYKKIPKKFLTMLQIKVWQPFILN